MMRPALSASALLAVAALSGCEERDRPWAAPPSDRVVEEPPRFLPSDEEPSLLGDAGFLDQDAAVKDPPLTRAEPAGGLWAACHEGFAPSGDPTPDVVRLGMICGPANGMHRHGSLLRGEVRPDAPATEGIEVTAGHCYRVFVAGDLAIDALAVSAETSSGQTLAEHASDSSWAILDPSRPFCAPSDGSLAIVVETEARGRYAAEVWELPRNR